MADDNNAQRFTLTNNAPGPRGVNTPTGYVEIPKGAALEVDLVPAELQSAKDMDCFDIAGAKGSKAPASGSGKPNPPDNDGNGGAGGSLPNNIQALRKLARDENIDLGAANSVADTKAAIVAARQAKADQAGKSDGDQLDDMDDDTLRNTVSAITGKPVAELAGEDRAALLILARGE